MAECRKYKVVCVSESMDAKVEILTAAYLTISVSCHVLLYRWASKC